jgi:UDP-2,3-diacylglucosamine pyrophosphatase LpxH
MSVDSRLTEVFQSAEEIQFDDSSKFIFFSDCHRGDNSWSDDFAKNQSLYFFALEYYFNEGFTYIELGDGDELYENKRFSVIRAAHSHVFWRLSEFYKAGRFHMIYGNHDMERADPKVVEKTLYSYEDYDHVTREKITVPLFDGIQVHEGLKLKHTPSGGTIFLVHGFQGDLINDGLWKVGRFLSRTFWRPLQLLGVNDLTRPAKNYRKRDALEREIEAWIRKNNRPTIFGHTHRPSFSEEGKPQFFNDGSCVHPRCITGIEIDQGDIQLIKWWLCPDSTGSLQVTREVLAGPRKVASLFV